ncbi:dipeptide epimerase, partial [bacterium]|nr:dipeptide epimerase [bacterium]
MKIKRIEFWTVNMKLSVPYTIAYETIDSAANVFLKLETDSGHIGYGCAAPDLPVTGETAETVEASLRKVEGILLGEDALRRTHLLEEVRKEIPAQPSARAAIDMALHDLLGKSAGQPLWKLLGGFRERILTSLTIGILETQETVEHALSAVGKGFHALKLKGGSDLESDVERLMKVREAVGHEIELRFDANQGYSLAQAKEFIERTRAAKLELLEQPTPKEELAMMGSVSA